VIPVPKVVFVSTGPFLVDFHKACILLILRETDTISIFALYENQRGIVGSELKSLTLVFGETRKSRADVGLWPRTSGLQSIIDKLTSQIGQDLEQPKRKSIVFHRCFLPRLGDTYHGMSTELGRGVLRSG